MTDEEIYCSKEYKDSAKAVILGILSGILIVLAIELFLNNRYWSAGGVTIFSLFSFLSGIYIGNRRLFEKT